MAHQCKACGKTFSRTDSLNRHHREKHAEMECALCPLVLYGLHAYEKHQKSHGVKTGFACTKCGKTLSRKNNLKKHERSCAAAGASTSSLKRPYTLLDPEVTFDEETRSRV